MDVMRAVHNTNVFLFAKKHLFKSLLIISLFFVSGCAVSNYKAQNPEADKALAQQYAEKTVKIAMGDLHLPDHYLAWIRPSAHYSDQTLHELLTRKFFGEEAANELKLSGDIVKNSPLTIQSYKIIQSKISTPRDGWHVVILKTELITDPSHTEKANFKIIVTTEPNANIISCEIFV
jgi:hypothetical protein